MGSSLPLIKFNPLKTVPAGAIDTMRGVFLGFDRRFPPRGAGLGGGESGVEKDGAPLVEATAGELDGKGFAADVVME